MLKPSVALLIKEPDSRRTRYVEVEHIPFTLGNTRNADVVLRHVESDVRVQFVKSHGNFCAQNLTGTKPGSPLRTIRLSNRTKFKTGGVFVQFFTTTLSATAMAERMVAMDLEVEKVRGDTPRSWDSFDSPELDSPESEQDSPKASADSPAVETFRKRAPSVSAPEAIEITHEMIERDAQSTRAVTVRPKVGGTEARRRSRNALAKSELQASNTEELLDRARALLTRLDTISAKIDELPKSVEERVAS